MNYRELVGEQRTRWRKNEANISRSQKSSEQAGEELLVFQMAKRIVRAEKAALTCAVALSEVASL